MIFLGIHVGHNASAALMIDGEIKFAVQEERFLNLKNFTGYPKKSIEYCLQYIKKKKLLIDLAGFCTTNNPIFPLKYPYANFFNVEDYQDFYGEGFYSRKMNNQNIDSYIKKISNDPRNNFDTYLPYKKIKKKDYFENYKASRVLQEKFLVKQSNNLIKEIKFLDHHTCHAYYSYYSAAKQNLKSCVVVLDSEGDGLNQSIWITENNRLVNVAKSDQCDLARIYKLITLILKMKPDEHEFKVMGLSSYSKKKYVIDIYENIFKNILKFRGIKIVHKNRPKNLYNFLVKNTAPYRFDNIAGAVQLFLEKSVSELLKRINHKYKIKNFYFSGGISMNVKMYKELSELKFIDKIFVPPSGSDESLSIGACYFLAQKNITKPLHNIYIGRNLLENDKSLNYLLLLKFFPKNKFKIIQNFNHKKLAKLLAKNDIIAIARDREEFGARALGNRSIIANPSNYNLVKKINESIKNRDFWMPFALSILKEDHKKFIKNNKNLICSFMTMTFDTKKEKVNKILGGCHPYDNTVRPQVLEKKHNVNFYSIINQFKILTKIPALLNTSLNLHGYPKAADLQDVIFTYKNSDLKFLYINDNFLVKKIN